MKFRHFGDPKSPAIVLLHGGGLSWWAWQPVADALRAEYHVVLPVIDGHGEDGDATFLSIEDSAAKLIAYIDAELGGEVLLLGGLSLGAQIAVEVLSTRPQMARHALIESALAYPVPGIGGLAKLSYGLAYGLVRQRWFSRAQAKSLFLPESMFEQYYADSQKMSKQTLLNISASNGNYALKEELLQHSRAKALVVAGARELEIVRRSARRLHEVLPLSELYLAPKMGHGELLLAHPHEYIRRLRGLLAK
ncbi:MAG: alpha/beta fold hydrolase [Anaerolineales bacterium]|nr:alpha/beta fold hydrolase [Anaerolineales bacterium]